MTDKCEKSAPMDSALQRVEVSDNKDECCSTQDSSRGCRRLFLALKICGVFLLVVLLATNFVVAILLWGTNLVENKITRDMVIENNTRSYEWWVKSPIQPFMQVRIFNYTNVDSFLAGNDDTLNLVEVGPYVYRETMERVNVVFHDNGTVSYQEKRSFKFSPERSTGSLDDVLTVPNMVMLGSASFMKHAPYLVRWGLSNIFTSINAKPFVTRTTRELFWGYDDPIFTAAKTLLTVQGKQDQIKKIGLLIARNGTSSARVSIHTGAQDISRLGLIDRYAGMDRFPYWSSEECNRIDGTDGSMFPPGMVTEHATLYMFMRDMCRKFPLVFKEYVSASGVEAMRFHPPRNVFENSLPENSCFCPTSPGSECLPSGVFNASPCAFNAPLMFSFPHFYLGDPALLEPFTGLKPDPAKHDMYLDIHPRFGFPVGGESRFQINMMVQKSFGVKQLEQFEDDTILPISWFEVVIDDVPPEVEKVLGDLRFATVTVKWMTFWTLLALMVVSSLVLGACLRARLRHMWALGRKDLAAPNCAYLGRPPSRLPSNADLKAKNNTGS